MPSITTPKLEISYEEHNPGARETIVFMHGFPDGVRTWDRVLAQPAFAGKRAIVPWTRGFGATRFLDPSAPRTGGVAGFGRDVLDVLDTLGIERCTLVGHDWGARAGYAAAILAPERIERLIAIAVGYASTPSGHGMDYDQVHAYWYQWLFSTPQGEATLRDDRRALCRYLWRSWSPSWRFDDTEFDETATAWDNPDFVPVVLHSYRVRWGFVAPDPRDADDERKLAGDPPIDVPTVVLHGAKDGVTMLSGTAGKERHFLSNYDRKVVPGAGHFVPRDAPEAIAAAFALP
jgi:pimeloyl-ACP methyl ester carboxylesterase